MSLITPTFARPNNASLGTIHQAPRAPYSDDDIEDYKADPKGFLLDKWELHRNSIRVFHNWIITATYYLPDQLDVPGTDRKLLLPDKVLDEALWQGKVGLVVAMGPLAFKDDEHIKFAGQQLSVGDWVMYDIMEGRQFTIGRLHCRRLKDTQVVMQVEDPRLIY